MSDEVAIKLGRDTSHDRSEPRETHEIHASEGLSFRGCRRRWNWAYREGYIPKSPPKPLELGIALHIGWAEFYNPALWDNTTAEEKTQRAIEFFSRECARQQLTFLELTRQERTLYPIGDDYAERIELGIGMLLHYGRYTHPLHDNWFRPVKTEMAFSVPILDRTTGEPLRCFNSPACGQIHPHGAVVTCNGRVDMIVEDLNDHRYMVWDHKSAQKMRRNDRTLQLNPQIGTYLWALQHVLELDIKGFMYVEYRKDYPREPKLLKKIRNGCMFSTAADQPTEYGIFLDTVKKYDSLGFNDGCYTKYLEYLQGPDRPRFHERWPILKDTYEMEQIAANMADQAKEMVSPTISVYPSPGEFSCPSCAYYDPCVGTNVGEDPEYTLNSLYLKVK